MNSETIPGKKTTQMNPKVASRGISPRYFNVLKGIILAYLIVTA